MKKWGEGSRAAEAEYNEVEWERTVHRVLQHPPLRVRPERSCRWIKMRLAGIYGESAFPSWHRGRSFLLRATCGDRAGPAGLRAALLHGETRLQEFLSPRCCGLLVGGPHRLLRRGGGRGHCFFGGEEIFPLLLPLCGCEPCVRTAEGLPAESGGLHCSQHLGVPARAHQPGDHQKVQNGAAVQEQTVSEAERRGHHLQRGAGLLIGGFPAGVLHQSGGF